MNKNQYFYVLLGGLSMIGSNLVDFFEKENMSYYVIDKMPLDAKIGLNISKEKISCENLIDFLDSENPKLLCVEIDRIKKANKKNLPYLVVNLATEKIPFTGDRYGTIHNDLSCLLVFDQILNLLDADGVFVSTSDIYSFLEGGSSQDILNPRWAYSTAKIAGEQLCMGYHEKTGKKVFILRLFSCFGPYMNSEIPWKSGIISSFFHDIARYQMINISCSLDLVRDYTYVQDFISAFFFILGNDKCANIPINVGNPENKIAVKELYKTINETYRKLGFDFSVSVDYCPPSNVRQVESKEVDISFLQGLGWSPKWNIEDSFCETAQYFIDSYCKK